MTYRLVGLLPLTWVLLAAGCANFDYRVDAPAEYEGPVPDDGFRTLVREPLEYGLQDVEDRLVVQIRNTSDTLIVLLGDRSAVVDPAGQAHGLANRPIPPGSFVRLVIPPQRPDYHYGPRYGPRFGIGIGTTIGAADDPGYIEYGLARGSDTGVTGGDGLEPGLMAINYDAEPRTFDEYWTFDGVGSFRLVLTFRQEEETFQQVFELARLRRD